MEFEKQCRDGEACRGVIKKLFPSKRYGFAVCECAKHTGEAHFNYSDLDLPEQERSCLAVGWRIDFNVVEQHKKTDHCDYRAIQVKPVDVMVVQCEVTDVWDNEIATLTCRELTGKTIYVTRNKYNGKFESEAVTRRDTCRAAVTWEQMKQKKTFALHCSQDTVSPTSASPFRPKFKTPEKRLRRTDGHCTFSEPLMNASSTGYLDEMFMSSVCDHSDMLVARSGQDSGLETPEDSHHATAASAARSFGGPNLRVLTSTPTHKTDIPKPNHESGSSSSRYPIATRTPPSYSQSNKINRANSTGSVGSNSGANVTNHGYGNKFNNGTSSNGHHGINPTLNGGEEGKNITQSSARSSDATAGNDGHGGESNHSLMRSNSSPGEALLRDNRSCASRRNLDQEFETFYASPRSSLRVRSPTSPMRPSSSYSEPTSKMMSMLATHEQTRASDAACDSALAGENSGRYNSDSLFGLYDANNASDEIDIYTVRNQTQHNSYRSSWEHSLGLSSPPNTAEQLNHAGHRISLESKGSSVVRPLGGENLYSDMRPGSSTDFGI